MKTQQMNEYAKQVLGQAEDFAEAFGFEKEEIIDGIVITEEDLKDFSEHVTGYAASIENEEINKEYGIDEAEMINQFGILDEENKLVLIVFANENNDTLIKKQLFKY